MDMQDLLDDLNDRLGDANNAAGIGEAAKMRAINHGVRAMWPKVFRIATDSSLAVAADTYEYTVPVAIGDDGHIYRVEIEDALGRFRDLDAFQITEGPEGKILKLPHPGRHEVGQNIRLWAVLPIPTMATTDATFEGRDRHAELPVLYALGVIFARPLEDRVDHTRYSTVVARNGVDINEVMNTSQFWFAQFELLLDRLAMAWPVSNG